MKRKRTKKEVDEGLEFDGTVDHVLDLRGMIIPLTFLKITQGLRRIRPGETMEIMVSDPDTRRDFFKVLATFRAVEIPFEGRAKSRSREMRSINISRTAPPTR